MPRSTVLAVLSTLALAAPAAAATTIVPDRFDDPAIGTSCAPAHPAGTCSLRAAVTAATDGDAIALAAGTYALAHGELLVANDVSFTGAGADATTIRQTTTGARVVEFGTGTTSSMRELTVTGGNLVGDNSPNGTVGSPDAGAASGVVGAGILMHGTLTLTLVNVVGNSGIGGNGGHGATSAAGIGGKGGDGGSAGASGIQASGNLTLDRVTIAGNFAQGGDGGDGASATGSNAGGAGGKGAGGSGAIQSGLTTVLVVRDSTISGNTAFAGSGGDGGNGGPSAGTGGAGGRSVRGAGGGIFSNASATIVNSTIVANELHGGAAGDGGDGGIFGTGGAGGIAEGGDSGGIALFNGASGHFASLTIVGNGAFAGAAGTPGAGVPAGAAGIAYPANAGNLDVYSAALEIRDSVIAGGIASPSAENCSVNGGGGGVTSHGFNVDSLSQCIAAPAPGDRDGLDPELGALQDNGGPTKTMAPLAGSPLIDGGPAICAGLGPIALATDQRGATRGTPCDPGAYEAVAPTAVAAPSISGMPVTGETLTCEPGSFGGDGPQTLATAWLRDGEQAATGAQYAVPAADAGHSLACRVTASNAYGNASSDSAAVAITAAAVPPGPAAGGGAQVHAARLSKLRIRPKRMHRGAKAKVTFTLSGATGVRFAICRRRGKACKRLKAGAPKKRTCRRGANRLKLPTRRLKPGRYRLSATPAGGKASRVAFRVLR
jgi:hypothetical protein